LGDSISAEPADTVVNRSVGARRRGRRGDDQPLKGDEEEGGDTRPRVIPVHPELAKSSPSLGAGRLDASKTGVPVQPLHQGASSFFSDVSVRGVYRVVFWKRGPLETAGAFIERQRAFWSETLDSLAEYVEQPAARRSKVRSSD